jgi:hypothetical protein
MFWNDCTYELFSHWLKKNLSCTELSHIKKIKIKKFYLFFGHRVQIIWYIIFYVQNLLFEFLIGCTYVNYVLNFNNPYSNFHFNKYWKEICILNFVFFYIQALKDDKSNMRVHCFTSNVVGGWQRHCTPLNMSKHQNFILACWPSFTILIVVNIGVCWLVLCTMYVLHWYGVVLYIIHIVHIRYINN